LLYLPAPSNFVAMTWDAGLLAEQSDKPTGHGAVTIVSNQSVARVTKQ
jgi:hypothetical protein